MVFGDGALVPNQFLQLVHLLQIFTLESIYVLLAQLYVTLQFQDIDQKLPLEGEFLLEALDHRRGEAPLSRTLTKRMH